MGIANNPAESADFIERVITKVRQQPERPPGAAVLGSLPRMTEEDLRKVLKDVLADLDTDFC